MACLLKDNDSGALALLRYDQSLAWVKDDACGGGYPLHIAAWRVSALDSLHANFETGYSSSSSSSSSS